MIIHIAGLYILADGMGEPGLDVPMPFIAIVFGVIVGLITGISRWRGATRKKAVCIPCVPLGLLTIISIPIPLAGQGGAMPLLDITMPAFGIALVASLITVFLIEDKKT